jgi:hypothetical protein
VEHLNRDDGNPLPMGSFLRFSPWGGILSIGIFLQPIDAATCTDHAGQCDFGLVVVVMWLTPIVAAFCGAATVAALVLLKHRGIPLWWIPLIGCVLTFRAFLVASGLAEGPIQT